MTPATLPLPTRGATPARPAGRVARDIATSVFERHHDELFRAALRACRDPETAEDLVQEALVRLMVEVDTRGAPDNVRAWLHRVICNLAVSLGRRATVRRRYAGALVRRDEPATPEAIVLDHEARSALAAALRDPAGGHPDRAPARGERLRGGGDRGGDRPLRHRDPHDDEQGTAQAPRQPGRVTSPGVRAPR